MKYFIDTYFDANMHVNFIVDDIISWFNINGKDCNAIVGMSGGKDSTIAAALLVKALGKERVIGVAMPDVGQSLNDADKICEWLGIRFICMPIGDATSAINKNSFSDQAVQNIPPRIRMTYLYAIAQTYNGRVINTCNLSEDMLGYSTLFGDSAGSYSTFRHFTCSEVQAMGIALGLPYEWVYKTPDDGLPNSCPDEEKFGFTYDELDRYIRFGNDEDFTDSIFEKIVKMVKNSGFKRDLIDIPSFVPYMTNYLRRLEIYY